MHKFDNLSTDSFSKYVYDQKATFSSQLFYGLYLYGNFYKTLKNIIVQPIQMWFLLSQQIS